MTRPPRPKYPSDLRNYHDIRKPCSAHTIRVPEEFAVNVMILEDPDVDGGMDPRAGSGGEMDLDVFAEAGREESDVEDVICVDFQVPVTEPEPNLRIYPDATYGL
ncbi:hypothetical protein R1sor_014248 [Riccia sorocarpa]|uniref:Transposase n=1 Tax=Riccia sorocarpa TaxID=122646 RepID=A0ABD3HCQ9_9MARC